MQKRYHTLENIIFDAIVYLVMAFVLICCLVPFIYMLAVSFSGTKPLINGENVGPKVSGLPRFANLKKIKAEA